VNDQPGIDIVILDGIEYSVERQDDLLEILLE